MAACYRKERVSNIWRERTFTDCARADFNGTSRPRCSPSSEDGDGVRCCVGHFGDPFASKAPAKSLMRVNKGLSPGLKEPANIFKEPPADTEDKPPALLEMDRDDRPSSIMKKCETISSSGSGSEKSMSDLELDFSPLNKLQYYLDLCEEVCYQSQNLEQATKAIAICECRKKFKCGKERLEAEKVLLLADLRRKLLLEQLQKIGKEDILDNPGSKETKIVISDVELPLPLNTSNRNKSWYIAVCSYGTCLQASPLLAFPSKPDFLRFPNVFVFDYVPQVSSIVIQIFELKMEDIYKKSKSLRQFCCFGNKPSIEPRKHKTIQYNTLLGDAAKAIVFSSIFQLQNSLTIKLLPNGMPRTISECYERTTQGTVRIKLNPEAEDKFAFLSVGRELSSYIIEGTKWSYLEGSVFQFWDGIYEPVVYADFRHSLHKRPRNVNNFISRLPRTVFFETDSKKKYFLASDTGNQLNLWKNRLNSLTVCFNLQKFFN